MALSRITEAVASFTDLTIADDLTLSDDLLLASDANIIKFGTDADVTITHVADTGLLLNSTSVIQFNDASQTIGAPSGTKLDIKAGSEIELTSTLIDIVGNLTVSGTIIGAGALTAATSITVGNAALTEAELELLDGLTAGTAIASKVVTTDANIDSSGMRNLTITGELDAATGDFSGVVDVAGTTTVVAITASGLVTANADMLIGGTTPTLTIGDAGAEDAKIVFDGNAQDFHVGLDDSSDDLVIGLGSALGTTPAISIDENVLVTINDDVNVVGRSTGTITTDNDGSFNLAVSNNWKCTTAADLTLTLTSPAIGQSGNILFINDANRTISAHASLLINADVLSAISATGSYHLTYYATATSGNNTILVSASAILT